MTSDIVKSCVVIRCNNVLRYYDENGNKIYEPCHFDETVRFTKNNTTPDISISNGEYVVIVQKNERTEKIIPNQRFIFGTPKQRMCIRVYGSGIRNFLNSCTSNENSHSLSYIYAQHYQYNSELDDLENGFADAYKNQYSIDIQSKVATYQVGSTVKLSAIINKNDSIINALVSWKSSDAKIATIDNNGNFTAIGAGNAIITAYMTDNPNICSTLDISVENIGLDNYTIQILPSINYLLQTEEQVFTVYLYNNGIKQSNPIKITNVTRGVPKANYEFTKIDDNAFSIKNLIMCMNAPVVIKCECEGYSDEISLELRGVW